MHYCNVHPRGAPEMARYWCGHTCADPLCRAYEVWWVLTHPLTSLRHAFNLDARGRHRR